MKKLVLLGLIVLFVGCPAAPKNSARIYIEQGDYTRAKEQILLGLKGDPGDYEYYCLLAKTEIGLSNWEAASKAFLDGLQVDSMKAVSWLRADERNISVYWQAFYNAALLLITEEKFIEALRVLNIGTVLDPKDVDIYILQATVYTKMSNEAKAREAYATALGIDPENPEAYLLIGTSFFNRKEYDSAVVKLSEAIKFFDDRYQRTGKVLFQNLPAIDKDIAHTILRLAASKNEADLDQLVKVKLGFDAGLNAMGANIEKFYKTCIGYAHAYYYMGMSYYNQKNEALALQNIEKSLEIMPDDLDALYFGGELLIRKGKYQEAARNFERITQLKSDDITAWFYVAVCYTQLKDYPKALDIYETKVLTLDPKNIDAMTNLAYVYREMGNTKKSVEWLLKAEQLQKEK